MNINLENINEFLTQYPVKNIECNHDILTDYTKISDFFDGSFGYLSYLEFKSQDDTEIFLGSYPLNGSELWKCKKCGKLKFFYTETGGHYPKTVTIDVDYNKKYISEPFAKSISISKNRLEAFIETFHFHELKSPEKIESLSGIKVIDNHKRHIFGFFEHENLFCFNIIANREFLKKVFEFERLQQ